MVTSPLSSNNVPCDVYPINDKNKLKSNKRQFAVGSVPNKIFTNRSTNRENIAKNRGYIIEKRQLNFQKSTIPEDCDNKTDPVTYLQLKNYAKSSVCEYNTTHKNLKNEKEYNLKEILQEAFQDKQRDGFVIPDVLRGGTDTGYSSRCSTPPIPLNVGDNSSDDGQREQQIVHHDPNIIPIPNEVMDVHAATQNKSPSACSDSSNGSNYFHKGRSKYPNYQSYERFNVFHQHHSQRLPPRGGYFLSYNDDSFIDQKYDDNYRCSGRIRCQRNNGNYSNFQKTDRIRLPPQGHHYYSHNSSHPQEPQQSDEYQNTAEIGHQFGHSHYQRLEGRGRNWNGNSKYSNGKNHPFANPSYHYQTNFQQNGSHSSNIYYQLNSQHDLREVVRGSHRTLTDAAGTFSAPPKNQCGKWIKDYHAEATVMPPDLLNQSEWDALSSQVWNLFTKHQQLDSTFRSKMELKERISHVIWNVLPMCRLFVVGSSLSGFGANSSDMDMCLMVTPRNLDQRNEAQAVLRLLQRELNNCGFVEKMELITAKVPILKFRDSKTKIDIDLNCNNSVGIQNTHLLNAYSQLDWRVRPLVLVVKLWAQHHHINNAKDMTISSYSLVLMVIHYLQYGLVMPLLPCLHKAYPDKFNTNNLVFKMPVTERLPVFISNNTQTLGELFFGFLEYYVLKFTFIETALSVRTGGIIPTEECRNVRNKKNDYRMWKYLCIEEPFDFTNTARSVYDEVVFEKVKNVFRDCYSQLKEAKILDAIFSKS